MPEIRIDPVTGRQVILASERSERPDDFRSVVTARATTSCAFCVGHEEETPISLAAYGPRGRLAGNEPWLVRVVPNKYPALTLATTSAAAPDPLFTTLSGCGGHEVIIESPRHVASMSQLSDDECSLAFRAYRDRLLAAREKPEHATALVFKNMGPEAGASLEHVHSQILGLPHVPPHVAEELAGSAAYFKRHERCVFCDILQRELVDERRVVAETHHFVAVCPFASRLAYEICVLSRAHASRFEMTADDLLSELALLVRDLVRRLETVLERPAYNYLIHSAPFRAHVEASYHWHIELFPRLAKLAGFEWGTGCFINAVPPETAAARLREV